MLWHRDSKSLYDSNLNCSRKGGMQECNTYDTLYSENTWLDWESNPGL